MFLPFLLLSLSLSLSLSLPLSLSLYIYLSISISLFLFLFLSLVSFLSFLSSHFSFVSVLSFLFFPFSFSSSSFFLPFFLHLFFFSWCFVVVIVLLSRVLFHCFCCWSYNYCFCCCCHEFCFCIFFCFVVVVVLLFCYVVKLGKAQKQNKKKHPQKVEVLPGIFYKTSYGCMCQSFFLGCFVDLCLAAQKHYKNRVVCWILTCWFKVFWSIFQGQ